MVVNMSTTITGREVSDNWVFYGIMAERVSNMTGAKIYHNDKGMAIVMLPVKDLCIYTGRIVRNGYKIMIN